MDMRRPARTIVLDQLDERVRRFRPGAKWGSAGPGVLPASSSTPDLESYVRRDTQTAYHPAGTCAMRTVVDAGFRVHGVDALRVVDASVMPVLVRGNTTAPSARWKWQPLTTDGSLKAILRSTNMCVEESSGLP